MALTNRLTTSTEQRFLPKLVDTVLGDNVLANRVLTKAKKWRGKRLEKAFKYQNGTSGGSFSGFDTFATTASDRRQLLQFDPKFYEKPVVLPLTEVDVNETSDAGVINLAATELAMAAQEMADEIGTLFYSDGSGNSSKDFLGLQAIIDDGTNAATYGGLTRATYGTLDATYTDSSGTLSLAKMATLYNACKSGIHKPTIGLTTETIFSLYEQLLTPMQRIEQASNQKGGGLQGNTGFTGLAYKGFPIMSDEKCTSGVLYFINENFLDWYAIKAKMNRPIQYDPSQIEGNNYTSNVTGFGFSWTGWLRPTNGYSIIGHIILGGEMISTDPGKQGQLHSITGV